MQNNSWGREVVFLRVAASSNTYVKHDDAVIEEEIEFVLEITSSFMKHLVRLHARA